VKRIPLTRGKFAIVDDNDFGWLSRFSWCAYQTRSTNTVKFYAGRSKGMFMHRLIMNPSKDQVIDHINRDSLDNRRSNLRICTKSKNSMNQAKTRGVSKYKGVNWDKYAKAWRASIFFNKRKLNLGNYHDEAEAAKVYNDKAKEVFGQFALLNPV